MMKYYLYDVELVEENYEEMVKETFTETVTIPQLEEDENGVLKLVQKEIERQSERDVPVQRTRIVRGNKCLLLDEADDLETLQAIVASDTSGKTFSIEKSDGATSIVIF